MSPKYAGFFPLRRGIWEHVRDGRITPVELTVYAYIGSQADTRTGIWEGSAGALEKEIRVPERTARKLLKKLESSGYIKRFRAPGNHFCYPILVNKFFVTERGSEGKYVNASESTGLDDIKYFAGSEACSGRGSERGGERAPQRILRELDNTTIESAYADTQLSASEVAAREPQSAAPPKPRAASERQRATRFPENFQLSDKLRGYAVEHQVPAGEVEAQWEHFENHHKATGKRFMDWNRAWYTWVGNYKQFARGARHGESSTERRRREADEQTARVVAMLQAKRAH